MKYQGVPGVLGVLSAKCLHRQNIFTYEDNQFSYHSKATSDVDLLSEKQTYGTIDIVSKAAPQLRPQVTEAPTAQHTAHKG